MLGLLNLRSSTRRALAGCDRIGDGARLTGSPYIANLGRIEIGRDFTLSSSPVVSHLVTGSQGVLRIGDRVSIGHGAAIAAHAQVDIGDGAHLGPFAMILDTDFHEAGDHRSAGESSPIRIGRNVRVGARVTVLRGAAIGDGVQIRAGSVVSGEIPAGVVAGGVPARVEHSGPAPGVGTETVPEIVRRTLGMAAAPRLTDGPEDLEGWTSLGALNLLLSLEEAFGIALRPEQVLAVRSVADLVDLVEQGRA